MWRCSGGRVDTATQDLSPEDVVVCRLSSPSAVEGTAGGSCSLGFFSFTILQDPLELNVAAGASCVASSFLIP